MLRAALLTEDPALRAAISGSALPHPGCVIDLSALRETLPKRRAAVDCDILIVDLRHPEHDWVWTVRVPRGIPTLVIADRSCNPSARLPLATQRDLTFLDAQAPSLLNKVRRFVGFHAAPPDWSAQFGSYVLRTKARTVELLEQGALRLSEHKFRFILGLFLHRRVKLHWSDLHRLAWGDEGTSRISSVAAHAEWAREMLELDGSHGFELLSAGSYFELRQKSGGTPRGVTPSTSGQSNGLRKHAADPTSGAS